jgi:hypothetical protein
MDNRGRALCKNASISPTSNERVSGKERVIVPARNLIRSRCGKRRFDVIEDQIGAEVVRQFNLASEALRNNFLLP